MLRAKYLPIFITVIFGCPQIYNFEDAWTHSEWHQDINKSVLFYGHKALAPSSYNQPKVILVS